ncbi:MAG: nitrophenyl compound nitroreductase subunit ArsF family protein, partial [bacterium]
LVRADACLQLEGEMAGYAEMPLNFKQEYEKHGALCLLETLEKHTVFESRSFADMSILDETPEEMKQRLLKMIASKSEYFIMTGSDARDLQGCCPSDGVKAANLLVEAGVLQVVRTESAPDACPVNIYAFAGEIRSRQNQPEFAIDQPFRARLKSYLHNHQPVTPAWMPVLRWSLLLFVLFSLGVMARNVVTENRATQGYSEVEFVDTLDLPFQSGVVVLLFHRSQRCAFCLNMEAHTRAALNASFAGEVQAGSLAFRMVDMEQQHYKTLVQKLGLFTSSVVLIALQEGKISRWEVFEKAWDLTERREEFMQKFKKALQNFEMGLNE